MLILQYLYKYIQALYLQVASERLFEGGILSLPSYYFHKKLSLSTFPLADVCTATVQVSFVYFSVPND